MTEDDDKILAELPAEIRAKLRDNLGFITTIKKNMYNGNYNLAFKDGFDDCRNPCLDVFYLTDTADVAQVRLEIAVTTKDIGNLLGPLSEKRSKGLPSKAYDVPNILKDGILYMRKEDFKDIGEEVLGPGGSEGLEVLFE